MVDLFATSKTLADLNQHKSHKMPSILRSLRRVFRHSSESPIKQDAFMVSRSVSKPAGSSGSEKCEEGSRKSPRSRINKQISLESTSSFATTVSSTIPSSPPFFGAGIPLPDTSTGVVNSLEAISSLESLHDKTSTADDVRQVTISAPSGTVTASVCQDASSSAWCDFFSSASSSSLLLVSQTADDIHNEPIVPRDIAAAHSVDLIVPNAFHLPQECAVYETSDVSSVETIYQSVSSGPSTGDSSSYKSSFDWPNDEPLYTEVISGVDNQSPVHLASHGSDAAEAVDTDATSATTLWHAAQGMTWTDCFSSDSSSSDLCNLMSNKDTAADTHVVSNIEHQSIPAAPSKVTDGAQAADAQPASAVTLWDDARALSWTDCFGSDSSSSSLCELASNERPSPERVARPGSPLIASFDNIVVSPTIFFPLSTFYSGERTLPSIGIAATLLMLGHSRYPDEDTAECCPAPSTSFPPVSPTLISAIAEQDANETFYCQDLGGSGDYPVAGPGSELDMALFDIAEEDEPEESFHEGFDDSESMSDYNNHEEDSDLTYRNGIVAHVINNATHPSLWRGIVTGIVWDDLRFFPTITEEDEESAGSVVAESVSFGSLLTASSDQFDYAQYSLPTESSANSDLSDDYGSRLPPHPMSRCCMREDFAELDDE